MTISYKLNVFKIGDSKKDFELHCAFIKSKKIMK